MPLSVTSEIGLLEAVLVHTPGAELRAVTPGNKGVYLYDDIIQVESAQREHRRFVAVLQRFAKVYQVADLLAEALERPEARDFFIQGTLDVVPAGPLSDRMQQLEPRALARLIIEGVEQEGGVIARALNSVGYVLPPLPNLFFPRDVGIVLGQHVVVGSMRHGVRWTEELLVKTLFAFHPALANGGLLYDGSEERRSDYTLEGGDVHILRPDLLVLGFSERTSPAAIDHLTEVLFAQTSVTDVLVVVMPKEPTAIHLDMLFTQVDRELCVVYPPYFVGPERLAVLHRRKGRLGVREMPDFFTALREVDQALEPIFAGGDRRAMQDREQWTSGCNFVALKPGLIVSYRRNEDTIEELKRAGFRAVSSVEFVAFDDWLDTKHRIVITIEGDELVRGGGGPRCMTLPLRRAAV
ncbi:MAG TPA: arginine deiminase family protein [Gemmatimonadales bacterium]|nr:arginine deiminase family protein [Gemmatimonadales bacterium]